MTAEPVRYGPEPTPAGRRGQRRPLLAGRPSRLHRPARPAAPRRGWGGDGPGAAGAGRGRAGGGMAAGGRVGSSGGGDGGGGGRAAGARLASPRLAAGRRLPRGGTHAPLPRAWRGRTRARGAGRAGQGCPGLSRSGGKAWRGGAAIAPRRRRHAPAAGRRGAVPSVCPPPPHVLVL